MYPFYHDVMMVMGLTQFLESTQFGCSSNYIMCDVMILYHHPCFARQQKGFHVYCFETV